MISDVLTPLALAILVPLTLAAFAAETVVGFGAVLLLTTIGSMVLPTSVLVPALVSLDLALCVALAVRHRAEIDAAFLLKTVLPAVLIGLLVGIGLIMFDRHDVTRRVIGAVLVIVAVREMGRARTEVRPLSRAARWLMLLFAGIVHFATATGGLVVVYVVARSLLREGRHRATLFACWAALDALLLLSFLESSQGLKAAFELTVILLPSCVIGLVVGERAYRKLSGPAKSMLVYAALALAGTALLIRG